MTCSPDAWHALWEAFHATRLDPVPVPRAALAAICDCAGHVPPELVAKAGRTRAKCGRAPLFALLVQHGRICT